MAISTSQATPEESKRITLGAAFRSLAADPGELLLRRWNWKSSLFSSLFRSQIFLAANWTAGWKAAAAAAAVEFTYRAVTAGFYGSVTQAFRRVEPGWHAALAVMFLLPLMAHTMELAIHWLRGTPNLTASLAASVSFTILSTLFNLHAMRRGVLVTGGGEERSIGHDMRSIPATVATFLAAGPLLLFRGFRAVLGTRS